MATTRKTEEHNNHNHYEPAHYLKTFLLMYLICNHHDGYSTKVINVQNIYVVKCFNLMLEIRPFNVTSKPSLTCFYLQNSSWSCWKVITFVFGHFSWTSYWTPSYRKENKHSAKNKAVITKSNCQNCFPLGT